MEVSFDMDLLKTLKNVTECALDGKYRPYHRNDNGLIIEETNSEGKCG